MARVQKWLKKYWLLLVAVVLLIIFLFLPLPFYVEGPGTADQLSQYVKVAHQRDQKKGSFRMTTVSVIKGTPAMYVFAKVMPDYEIESLSDITGNQDNATYNKVQTFYMRSAINQAIYVAYREADKSVKVHFKGIYVLEIMNNSQFKKVLQVGDTITEVNHQRIVSAEDAMKKIKAHSVGSSVTITYQHNGKTKTATRKLVRLSTGKPGIGIGLTDNNKVTTKIPVSIDPHNTEGPSAGLMFTLQVYSQLSKQNLRKGRNIAGTGTIATDGSVGEIGGIDKKIVAAKKAGATIFFAPYVKPTKLIEKYEPNHLTNYQLAKKTAKRVDPKLKVVPVQNFEDAVKYLQKTK
ncbi:PDZ domain-containing protein [Pediococcus ethanolidurans]|uniref:SepM family pheromone-processing serine protease n=1 Tax=Pediococcus ethanolidurans TaxID=319653 RepID=UPI001C1EF435|nr:SepM family pheromone-processing serine protease [Pediococcus ethanolidurans]MBU7563299.1 PDZ domain-containing protein [Pediococcus ethanolidurans]MCV3320749.1 PDZ domain-containing protein [Pediococcus ethanolidurans]MCV3322944.1 PDZ domain-containing protein [Pediococcus ethanolidurans]MCV3328050.1 PDZ domain-containing protein [Pediococcus ethanolidurans]MCV3554447.1 PDZ domain-containing protein [Pediococcus ethanolidurans]